MAAEDDANTGESDALDESAIEELRRRRTEAALGGGQARIDAQHDRDKLTARERIDYLLDEDSFEEFDRFVEHQSTNFGMAEKKYAGDGVVTGYGEVDGRTVFVFAHDFTILGGSVGEAVADKICKVMDKAIENGVPIIGLNDSGGARIQEGIASLTGFAKIFQRNTKASGLVPQISAIMGPCAGGATYSPALTDFTFMVEDTAQMMITGPDVIETVTGEQITMEELGGASAHANESGVAHRTAPTEEEVLDDIKRLLSYLPQNNVEDPPRVDSWDDPDRRCEVGELVPDAPRKPYDVTNVIGNIVDDGSFFETHGGFARTLVTGLARMDGRPVGVVANQPSVNAGTLNIESSQKGARFVRFCDSFNIPVLTFVDVPGFMPGTDQEHNGIIRHGAKLIYAYAEATVPLSTVILRKAYGGAYIVMGSKLLGADTNYAWPGAETAVMGPRGAVDVLYRDELADADDPEATRQALMDEYREEFANPYSAAERGYVDDVIEPNETRKRLIRDLDVLDRKRTDGPPKDHGNIQL
ncbi:acyl-CoA carboxylase subunit beta [Halococcus dombrowskii]|uniref:Acyl-CoA carboxylase subunit beta n=1 Tax=Halococcus dombrowskii TaxID=179637 RepID=A0AAV3SCQ2_HALDO|nr:acyl-CoA carboxylase subunit beta [Halococcus dombrowskii]UOO94345.1 acyl-CoA carboxylase subunit beta [Halococcus dombrowskii]